MEIDFILKKILSVMLMPLSIDIILITIGLYFLYNNNIKKAKIFLTISFTWIILISCSPFSNIIISPLENSYSKATIIPKDIKYILLLGGDKKNRGWEVLNLYNQMSNAKIITSGYKGSYKTSEAVRAANLLIQVGIPQKDIIIHDKPRDTKEEVIVNKQLIGVQPFFLVTSAYHMPRAIALFKKEGLNPIAAPIDFKTRDHNIFDLVSAKNLIKVQLSFHEYFGILWAKLRGQI